MKRHTLIMTAACLLLGSGITGWLVVPLRGSTGTVSSPASVDSIAGTTVRVARVVRGPLVHELEFGGRVRAERSLVIAARVSGDVASVRMRTGLRVRAGDTLVLFERAGFDIALERARTALLGAQIDYATQIQTAPLGGIDPTQLARRAAEASSGLAVAADQFARGVIDRPSYERLRRRYEADLAYCTAERADVIAFRSGLPAAQENYRRAVMDAEAAAILAPFDGIITSANLTSGQHLTEGDRLGVILDPASCVIDIDVMEFEALQVREGARASIELSGSPGAWIPGTVRWVSPEVSSQTHALSACVAPEMRRHNAELIAGMYARVRVHTGTDPRCLLIPRDAVLERADRHLVFLASGGRAIWRYVDVGGSNDNSSSIRSGVAEGDSVIVSGHLTLVHGADIRVEP